MTTVLSCGHLSRSEVTGVVTGKEVKRQGKSDKYLIFIRTEDGSIRTLENTDSLIEGKFRSSDIYGGIEVGKKYRLKVYGWRWGCMSWYENIVGYEEVKQ
jgi:hypothetical protein